MDSLGVVLSTYTYSAYGEVLSVSSNNPTDLINLNPFRFKGYYYDTETELYYLTSRYYNPEVGRLINADGYISTGQDINSCNMFAYCGNNPINRVDPTGHFWKAVFVVTTIVIVGITIVNFAKNSIIDAQKGVNDAEKELAKNDPFGAIKAKEASEIASQYQKELYPNTYDMDSNQANAFLHAMWNAIMTDMMDAERAKKFADAHEAELLQYEQRRCTMDFFSNELGRQIALKYAGQGYDVFAQKIQEAIIRGEAYVIEWDEGN